MYQVPPYQREYSWHKVQWEALLDDLVDADQGHFLGTIITLNQTLDTVEGGVLELIDGQQRLTTLTLLMTAVYSVLSENKVDLDDDTKTDLTNLGRQLVRKGDGRPRVTPQTQGHNRDDYVLVLSRAGMPVEAIWQPYFPMRRVAKCFNYFRDAIYELAIAEGIGEVKAALRVLTAVQQAILVKIEVASHADAFVLFESLNNRGMPLTPVDLIKNHLLAESDKKKAMEVDEAFRQWNVMLTNLGDNYATQERFLRHYYNAFRNELPTIPNAPVATRTKLIRIYETLLADGLRDRLDDLVSASRHYGQISCVTEPDMPTGLDEALRRLMRAQGSPAYVLVLWLMTKQQQLGVTADMLAQLIDVLTSFFVRRNLTGLPQTYALPRLFMGIIEEAVAITGSNLVEFIRERLAASSVSKEEFQKALEGPIYDDNSDITRFILATLSEDAMTKETLKDLWAQEKGHYVWTIEHILPQGANLPQSWLDMLGGAEAAAKAQEADVHRLGNLTITAYNSTLSNKSFSDKRDRVDAKGRSIGYRNALALNADLVDVEQWTVPHIEARTKKLAERVVARFPLE